MTRSCSRPPNDGGGRPLSKSGWRSSLRPKQEEDHKEDNEHLPHTRRRARRVRQLETARFTTRDPFTLPDLESIADARKLLGRLPGLVARAELTASEAGVLARSANDFVKAVKAEEANDNQERLEAMAAKIAELRAKMDA